MEGEELDWFRLASHLSMTVDEVRMRTNTQDFQKWIYYLDEVLPSRPTVTQHYLAQIAAEIRRSWVDNKHRASIRMKDFILEFVKDGEPSSPAIKKRWTKEGAMAAANRMKAFLFAHAGLPLQLRKQRKDKHVQSGSGKSSGPSGVEQ